MVSRFNADDATVHLLNVSRYVLSTTHLHEFKSADKGQAPIMSLYLPDQKVGSHSEDGSSSNKFILKGRQTGTMHRGHTWVFRAESHDTMLAWYEDIKALTETSPEERTQFVRTHSRSLSRSSRRSARSASSDGLDDEEDEEPFTGGEVDTNPTARADAAPRRPEPGGRFPSDIQVMTQRGLHASQSPSSISSVAQDYPSDAHVIAAASALPGSHLSHEGAYQDNYGYGGGSGYAPMDEMPSQAAIAHRQAQYDGVNPYTSEPVQQPEAEGGYLGGRHDAVPVVIAHNQIGSNGQELHQPSPEAAPAVASNELNNKNYTAMAVNDTEDKNLPAAVATTTLVDYDSVPRSETPTALQNRTLQGVPEAEIADHITPLATPLDEELPIRSNRSNDHRTDSIVTISNLDIPGKFPRGATNGSGTNANV